jgi:hypothetical protein
LLKKITRLLAAAILVLATATSAFAAGSVQSYAERDNLSDLQVAQDFAFNQPWRVAKSFSYQVPYLIACVKVASTPSEDLIVSWIDPAGKTVFTEKTAPKASSDEAKISPWRILFYAPTNGFSLGTWTVIAKSSAQEVKTQFTITNDKLKKAIIKDFRVNTDGEFAREQGVYGPWYFTDATPRKTMWSSSTRALHVTVLFQDLSTSVRGYVQIFDPEGKLFYENTSYIDRQEGMHFWTPKPFAEPLAKGTWTVKFITPFEEKSITFEVI